MMGEYIHDVEISRHFIWVELTDLTLSLKTHLEYEEDRRVASTDRRDAPKHGVDIQKTIA